MQVIKLLVRSFRRLRLFFCGLFTRPTAPRHAPWVSQIPSNPESAPNVVSINIISRHYRRIQVRIQVSLLLG
jgi:hypothetical protein